MAERPIEISNEPHTAVVPGTFDPVTNGHLDIVNRSLRMFGRVIVAVAANPKKQPLFSVEERLDLIRKATAHLPNVSAQSFDGLLVEYVQSMGGVAIVRGLRAISDFEYEFQMALMNRRIKDSIETVFMMPSEEYSYLTSTIIKELASLRGPVAGLVPTHVEEALRKKFPC